MVQKYPRKVKALSRVHARHRRQTDGFAMPLSKRNVWLKIHWLTRVIEELISLRK